MLPDLQDHLITSFRAWEGTCEILLERQNKCFLGLLCFWGNWAARQLGDLGRSHLGDAEVVSSQNEDQQEQAIQNLPFSLRLRMDGVLLRLSSIGVPGAVKNKEKC